MSSFSIKGLNSLLNNKDEDQANNMTTKNTNEAPEALSDRIEEADEHEREENSITSHHLSKAYFYQNARTGTISSYPLSAEQLCLLLSPTSNKSTTRPIHERTMVIEWDYINQAYSEAGWKECCQIPVLREACASWHYQDPSSGTSRGPISCRELASLLYPLTSVENLLTVSFNTRVWSAEIAALASTTDDTNTEQPLPRSDWRSISEDKHLDIALRAFHKHQLQMSTAAQLLSHDDHTMQTYHQFESKENGHDQTLDEDEIHKKRALQEFFNATAGTDDSDEDEEYASDNGTNYVRDRQTGEWKKGSINKKTWTVAKHKPPEPENNDEENNSKAKKRKKKKAKFNSKNALKWIYVQGLPMDTTEDEVAQHFQRAGIIELDPDTQRPRVKLYRHKDPPGELKGDASICYAREESVDLAVQVLDEGMFRPTAKKREDQYPLKVTRAKFEQRGELVETKQTSYAKKKVARLAAKQAVDWDESENGRITGGVKGLRIIVLKHAFTLNQLSETHDEDAFLKVLESNLYKECSELGTVEKITMFSQNPEGVVVIKFTQPSAATDAIKAFDGRSLVPNHNKVEAIFWDGVTDYTVRDEHREREETEQRHDEFGSWLDNQELPEEFRLRVDGES